MADCKYAIATITGSAALHLALKSLDIGFGDKVAVPDTTFAASINAIELAGAIPIIIDVHKDDWTIDTNLLEKAILKENINGYSCTHTWSSS